MDSLDAECLLMTMATEDGCVPAAWSHRANGSLACHFSDSPNELSWPAAAVADMAERWRAEPDQELPAGLVRMIAAHRTFASLIVEAGLDPPDTVVHDLEAAEVRARWNDRRFEVIVEALDGLDGDGPTADRVRGSRTAS